jgi:hypothetical protein
MGILFATVATFEEDVSPTRLYKMREGWSGGHGPPKISDELSLGVPAEAAGFFKGRLLADAHAAGFFHQKHLEIPQAKPGRV